MKWSKNNMLNYKVNDEAVRIYENIEVNSQEDSIAQLNNALAVSCNTSKNVILNFKSTQSYKSGSKISAYNNNAYGPAKVNRAKSNTKLFTQKSQGNESILTSSKIQSPASGTGMVMRPKLVDNQMIAER